MDEVFIVSRPELHKQILPSVSTLSEIASPVDVHNEIYSELQLTIFRHYVKCSGYVLIIHSQVRSSPTHSAITHPPATSDNTNRPLVNKNMQLLTTQIQVYRTGIRAADTDSLLWRLWRSACTLCTTLQLGAPATEKIPTTGPVNRCHIYNSVPRRDLNPKPFITVGTH